MAEALLKMLPDEDHDGIPDVLARLLKDQGFGLNTDNWRNRRRIIFGVAGTAWGACLFMVGIWAYKVLFTETDIQPNMLNLGTTVFWSMNLMASTLILAYVGISQTDTNSYRRHAADLAKSVPTAIGNSAVSYKSTARRVKPQEQFFNDTAPEVEEDDDLEVPSVPPTAKVITPEPSTDGPQRKPGIIT